MSTQVEAQGLTPAGETKTINVDANGNVLTAPAANAATGNKTVTVTVGVDANAYTAGDVVGGIITLPTVNAATGRPVKLRSVQVNDRAGQKAPINVYFFSSTPAGGTYTNNSPLVWNTGDSAKKVGTMSLLAADYVQDGTPAAANYSDINMKMTPAATSLFVLLVIQAAKTYAVGDLIIVFEFDQE